VTELAPADRTLPRVLRIRAEEYGTKPFLRWSGGERSYAETLDVVAQHAGALRHAGVGPGDRVVALSGNRIELVDFYLACSWLGAVFVPVNVAARGGQLTHILENADPRLVLVEPDLLPHLDAVLPAVPSLERLWTTEAADADWQGIRAEQIPDAAEPLDPHDVRPGDPAAIIYTSGTTGPSKGVVCPHAQFYWWGVTVGRDLGVGEDDVLYTVMPFFHVNAISTLWQALVAGATLEIGRRFSASRFWSDVARSGATVTYLLGAMVQILLKGEGRDEDSAHGLRIIHGPGTSKEAALAFLDRFGVRLVDGYGSTETNHVFSNVIGPWTPGTMGRLVPEFEAAVVDCDDQDVGVGHAGELVVRPREPWSIALGYYRMPEQTVAAWRNLWFHTGDLVVRDEEGTWRFVDRLKDSVRRRGENISSVEVEDVLATHPDVVAAAVVPVPSDLGDDEVMAFVVLRPGVGPDPVALVRHCEPRLAYFAIPRFVEFVAELPLTESGKIQKSALRERGIGPATWDRERAGLDLAR
jgi:crotonobetaine/carnitine-CoA ligase